MHAEGRRRSVIYARVEGDALSTYPPNYRKPPTAKPAPTRELLELIVGNPLPAGWGRMVGEGGGVGVGERATIQTIHRGIYALSRPFPPLSLLRRLALRAPSLLGEAEDP